MSRAHTLVDRGLKASAVVFVRLSNSPAARGISGGRVPGRGEIG